MLEFFIFVEIGYDCVLPQEKSQIKSEGVAKTQSFRLTHYIYIIAISAVKWMLKRQFKQYYSSLDALLHKHFEFISVRMVASDGKGGFTLRKLVATSTGNIVPSDLWSIFDSNVFMFSIIIAKSQVA